MLSITKEWSIIYLLLKNHNSLYIHGHGADFIKWRLDFIKWRLETGMIFDKLSRSIK